MGKKVNYRNRYFGGGILLSLNKSEEEPEYKADPKERKRAKIARRSRKTNKMILKGKKP